MRAQQLLALAGLILAGNVAIAAKVEQDDVPNRCWDACGSVVGVSRRCDDQHDNDSAELQCICNWEAAKTQIPLCAACITQYGHRDDDHDDNDDDHNHDHDHDNEALDLVRSCRFSMTAYNAAAATTLSATATGTTDPAAASATTTATTGSTSSTGTGSAGSSSQTSTGSTGGAATASPSPGAAAGMNAPGVLSLVAVAGLMPLAWL